VGPSGALGHPALDHRGRQELPLHHHRSGGTGGRAGPLTLTEFINLERSQHLHHLSSALAAATTPGDVAREAIAGGRRALGAHVGCLPRPSRRGAALSCLASSGHPPLLSPGLVPVEGTPSGAAFTSGRTITTTLGPSIHLVDRSHEIVPGVLAELGEPVTIVTEALMGSVGSLGVLALAFVGRPEPSEPELRFLSTLAGLTAQALERAQLFEQERQALRDAEAGRERLSLLSDVTKLLSSSLDPTTVMQRTMNLVVGRLSDACVVQVPGRERAAAAQRARVESLRVEAAQRLIGPDTFPSTPTHRQPSPIGPAAQLAPSLGPAMRTARRRDHRAGRAVHRQRRGDRRHDVLRRSGRSSSPTTSPWPPKWPAGPAWRCPMPPGSSGSTWWPRCCNAPCCPTSCPPSEACTSTPSTAPARPAPTSAGTGTTCSNSTTSTSSSASATSWAKGPRRPRSWARCAAPYAPTPWPGRARPKCSPRSTASSMSWWRIVWSPSWSGRSIPKSGSVR
jgi:hypothetical protein